MGSELHIERLKRAYESLEGLSCGDAFGERFFSSRAIAEAAIGQRALPAPPWFFTDDTNMALSILSTLEEHGEINQEHLVRSFARQYDPSRGYGRAMHTLLTKLRRQPDAWREESQALFRGEGSYGNGSAMRVAPLGAYFADDLDRIVEQAELSSVTTHCHAEAIAGAIGVAVAAGLAWQWRNSGRLPPPNEFLEEVIRRTPASHVRRGIQKAQELPIGCPVESAVAILGNGSAVTAPDTVPFALCAAARHLDDFEAAMWTTISALGDCDTNCAIVGGIVASYAGHDGIPKMWLALREPLPYHLLKQL